MPPKRKVTDENGGSAKKKVATTPKLKKSIASDAVIDGSKSKGTTAANVKSFEKTLFCTEGWISPRKLAEVLFAAANVMSSRERDDTTPNSVLEKFNYPDGETDGKSSLVEELESLATLEAKELANQKMVSIPQRLLLLARHDGGNVKWAQGGGEMKLRAEAPCMFTIITVRLL